MRNRKMQIWLTLAAIAVFAGGAMAQTDATWTGPDTGYGLWDSTGNWDVGVPDGAGDSATFAGLNMTDYLDVDLFGDMTVGSLEISGSEMQANMNFWGGGLRFDNNGLGASLLIEQSSALNPYTWAGESQQSANVIFEDDVSIDLADDLTITINNDDNRRYLLLQGDVADVSSNTLTIQADAPTAVRQSGGMDVDSLMIGANVTYRQMGNFSVNSVTVAAGATFSAETSVLSTYTLGTDITIGDGAMIAHSDLSADPLDTVQNLGVTPKYIYGIRGDTYSEGFDLGDPVTLEVGSTSTGPWKGIGAEVTNNSGNPRQHAFGTDLDTVNVSGDIEIRTTTDLARDGYGLPTKGVMSVNAKLTGGSASSTIDVTGPGVVIVTNNENTVQGDWKVTGGAVLRADVYGDTLAANTQDVLGDASNDIILDNGTLAFRAGGASQEADLDAGRAITIASGGGTLYTDYGTNWYASGNNPATTSLYAFQTAVEDGDINVLRGQPPAPLGVIEESTIGKLNLAVDGQLLGSGTLIKDGRGTVEITGSNTGFTGDVLVNQGTLIAAKGDSVGSAAGGGNVVVSAGAVYANGPAPSAADIARVSGDGVFALGGSYGGTIDLSSKGLWLHSYKPGSDNVAVSFANITPNTSDGYKFGGGGGVLFVGGSWGSDDVTIQGPGVTILTGDNSGSTGTLDFSAGGLGIGSDLAIGGSPASKKQVDLTWTGVDGDPVVGLLYANGQHGASANRGYEVNLKGGSVGFVDGFTLTSLDQLGVITNALGVNVIGIGFNGDSGVVDASGVDITNVNGITSFLIKRGSDSTLRLSGGSNSYTGATRVYAGTIEADNGDQLSSGQLWLYGLHGDNTSQGKLRLTGSMTWTGSELSIRGGSRLQPVGNEATIEVDAAQTATLSADFTVQSANSRLRRTGDGTLILDSIGSTSGISHGWGLTLEGGMTKVNEMPNAGDYRQNGTIIFDGGDVGVLSGNAAGFQDGDYGFWGMIVKDGTVNTVTAENNAVFQVAGQLISPVNQWAGELVFEGANETSEGADDWGIFSIYFDESSGDTWSAASDGTLTVKSGHAAITGGNASDRLPSSNAFTLNLLGGKMTTDEGTAANLTLNDGDGDVTTAAPQIADLNVYGSGDTTWDGDVRVVGNGFTLNRSGGAVAVAAGTTLTIEDGASANIGGSVDTLSDGANHVTVVNDGTFTVGGPKHVASISGTGTTVVNTGATLEVGSTGPVTQDTLEVNGSADVGDLLAAVQVLIGADAAAAVSTVDTAALDIAENGTLELKAQNGQSVVQSLVLATGGTVKFTGSGAELLIQDASYTEQDILDLVAAGQLMTDDTELAIGTKDVAAGEYLTKLTLPGDANLDGLVDVGDLGILAGNWETTEAVVTWDMGDFNGDGLVDVGDLGILAGRWDQSLPTGSIQPIPEPATLSLLAIGGLAVLRRKRRKRRK